MSLTEKGINGLQKISDASTSASELAATHKQFVTKQVINIGLLLVILIVFGCFDWVHLKFHFEWLLDVNFWGNLAMKVVADICAYNVGINFVIDEVIKKNKVLGNIKYIYENLNSRKQRDFEHYINHIYNVEEKKKVYIGMINRKIHLLNKFSRRSDRILYVSTLPEKQPLKLTNKYCIKRSELEYLKSEEYIDANIENLKVRYKDVDHSVFELEINGSQKIKKAQVTGSVTKGRIISSGTAAFGIVGISMFMSSFSVAPNEQEFADAAVGAINTVVKMCSDIGVIFWQFFRGILSATSIVSQQLTTPYVMRVEILKRYYRWRQDNGEKVPLFYLKLYDEPEEVEEEYQEIELTEEEYKKLKGGN